MNITSTINKDNYSLFKTQVEILKTLGFDLFSRKIYFFLKEAKNMYNISGNNIVTKIGCLITNRSVSNLNDSKLFNKTVYLCDVEFPKEYDMETIKRDFNKFVDVAEITPLYAFSNNHALTNKGQFYNYGLTLVDLSVADRNHFGVINFSKNSENLPLFKEIVYGNEYNPKYYTKTDAKYYEESHDTRNGKVEIFVDNKTKILCNKYGTESVDNFYNGVEQEGIFIDKRTMILNEFIASFFNKYMFLQFDDIEIIYNSKLSNPLNITRLNTFTKFCDNAKDFYIEQLMYDIEKTISTLKNDLKEDFYMVFTITDQFVILDAHLFKDNREIRITKPLYKLYGEFALDSEQILNDDIAISADIAKCDMLEQLGADIRGLDFVNNISGAISLIESATKTIQNAILTNQFAVQELIEQKGETCLLEDVREKYPNNPDN